MDYGHNSGLHDYRKNTGFFVCHLRATPLFHNRHLIVIHHLPPPLLPLYFCPQLQDIPNLAGYVRPDVTGPPIPIPQKLKQAQIHSRQT